MPQKPTRTAIGIDAGSHCIKAVQFERTSKGLRLAAAAALPRSMPGSALGKGDVERLCQVLRRGGFSDNDIVLAVPPEKLAGGLLELPPRAGGLQIEQIARMEVARSHRRAPDSFEMGCWELPASSRSGKATHVMAVACGIDDANALLDLFEEDGLKVTALDVRACALARAAAAAGPVSPGMTAVLDIGQSGGLLVVVYQQTVVYERSLAEAGMGRLTQALIDRSHLEADVVDYLLSDVGLGEGAAAAVAWPVDSRRLLSNYVESLVQELLTSAAYASQQYAEAVLDRVVLTGNGARIQGLDEHMTNVLGVPVQQLSLAHLAESGPSLAEAAASPAMALAAGLALYPAA